MTLTRRAARLAAGEAADRVTRFGDRLAEVAVRGRDAVAVDEAESALLLKDLNAAAGADGRRLAGDVTRQLTEVLDGELRTAAPSEIERGPRPARRAHGRGGRRPARAAARHPRAGAGPHRQPQAELGRRRAREHLLRAAPDLVGRQIGRARGDLQYRLAEATRALASSVQRRYAEATDRMRAALAAAEELRGVSAAASDEKERDLPNGRWRLSAPSPASTRRSARTVSPFRPP